MPDEKSYAKPAWQYKDPTRICLSNAKYKIGCFGCSRNRLGNNKRYQCILGHEAYPDTDSETCPDWRKLDK